CLCGDESAVLPPVFVGPCLLAKYIGHLACETRSYVHRTGSPLPFRHGPSSKLTKVCWFGRNLFVILLPDFEHIFFVRTQVRLLMNQLGSHHPSHPSSSTALDVSGLSQDIFARDRTY